MARRRGSTGLSALLLVDKPSGWTSHDVVARIKSATGEGRVGHAGTLDPMATGLLVVAVGPATRLLTHLQAQAKSYRATVTFGTATSTDDAEGDVVESAPVDPNIFEDSAIGAVLQTLVGTHQQRPPAYSAIKVDGKRSYAAARAGEEIELAPREITIDRVDFVSTDPDQLSITFDISVSKGTYIRAIARDLGVALGTVAHLSGLRRLTSGGLSVEGAHSVEDIVKAATGAPGALADLFTDPAKALGLPVIRAHDLEVASGRDIRARAPIGDAPCDPSGGPQRLCVTSCDGRVLGVYRTNSGDTYESETVIARPVLPPRISAAVVALGVFDGVHRGHSEIVRAAVAYARERGLRAVAVTHDPLPERVLSPEDCPAQITSLEARVALLEQLGVDEVIVIPMTPELTEMAANRYVTEVLMHRVDARAAFVGEDYRFGANASGTPDTLRRWMDVEVLGEVSVDGHRARSTDIRCALDRGDVAHVSVLTGRPVTVLGEVVRGLAIGATLGAPTANLTASVESRSLRHGVYAARVAVLSPPSAAAPCGPGVLDSWRRYVESMGSAGLAFRDAAVFVGRPTPDRREGNFAFEVHLLDVREDLYGAVLVVEMVQFLRPPITFPDRNALSQQIVADLSAVREVLRGGMDGE